MAGTITLTQGANTCTIPAPRYPEEPGRNYPMIIGYTMDGGHRVADMGDGSSSRERIVLHFKNLPAADKASLQTFIETKLVWATNLCTYTDPHGASHTNMRYIEGLQKAKSSKGERWEIDLVLEKDMGA